MKGLSTRAVLGCHQLEGRDCPAIFVFGSYMAVIGTSGADTVTITDDGAGNITATLNGTTKTASGIKAITVATFGGNDTISYTVEGDLTGQRAVAVDSGSGDDSVELTAGAVTGYFAFAATGGSGTDKLTATVGGVAAGAAAVIGLDGGIGDDTISATAKGEFDGYFALALSGNYGNDNITGDVDVAAGSTGTVVALEAGGFGDDNLTLNVTGDGLGGLENLIAVQHGGPDTDTGTATDNVTKLSIEQ